MKPPTKSAKKVKEDLPKESEEEEEEENEEKKEVKPRKGARYTKKNKRKN